MKSKVIITSYPLSLFVSELISSSVSSVVLSYDPYITNCYEVLFGSIIILSINIGSSVIFNLVQVFPSFQEYLIYVVDWVFGAATNKPPWSPNS